MKVEFLLAGKVQGLCCICTLVVALGGCLLVGIVFLFPLAYSRTGGRR